MNNLKRHEKKFWFKLVFFNTQTALWYNLGYSDGIILYHVCIVIYFFKDKNTFLQGVQSTVDPYGYVRIGKS